jgi:hypothetical protein
LDGSRTTSCEIDETFSHLELPSSTFSLPFVCVVMILPDRPPLVTLPTDGLADGVALTVTHDGVVELVVGALLVLVNLPIVSMCLFMHSI